jgi:hypothetical protein
MCRLEMIRVASWVGVWESLTGGLILGLMSKVMLAWVRVWGVPAGLMAMCLTSICMLSQCKRFLHT